MSLNMNDSNPTTSHEDSLLGIIVDYLFRDLDAYEAALYVFLYRKTLYSGETSIRIGKRMISSSFVRGSRGGGQGNRGGIYVNYQHLSRALKSLEAKGCIQSGDTTLDGTLYTVVRPADIPSVSSRLASERNLSNQPIDYFSDPLRRRELFERDHWTCQYCGQKLNPDTATLDHYVPQSKGGGNTKENLRTCCLLCNSIKSGRTYEEVASLLLQSVAQRRSKGDA
jgi:hypothetical protein